MQRALGNSFKELRFVFCQNSERSSGLRTFVARNYWKMRDANPNLPLIVRECEEADPYIIARYQYGIEKKALTANLTELEVEDVINDLVEQSKRVNSQI